MGQTTARFRSAEMYLKTILELSDDRDLVPISNLASHLGISPVSATEMVHRLVDRKWVSHEPYRGVHLTEEGLRRAVGVTRRHRIWECFLADTLELPWEKVHDLACDLEHAAGSEVTEALIAFLGEPETCPHGNPVPSAEGDMKESDATSLRDLRVGQCGRVLRVRRESRPILERVASQGLKPGASVMVEEIGPLDELRTVRVGQTRAVLGPEMAALIEVAPQVCQD